jgi:sugar fermentation stimulation protein A
MPIGFDPLVPATFIRRDNRFRVQVNIIGHIQAAHLANSGRLGELLVPGRKLWLAPADLGRAPQRRTAFDVALVEYAGRLVSVDARLPGRLVKEALQNRQLAGFTSYDILQTEVRLGQSRIDFRLDGAPQTPRCWLEVKSVTLVENGTARFPDAPTQRGERHVTELMKAVSNGDRGAVLFVVQRDDAQRFTPYNKADSAFARTLRQAAQMGVSVLAWRCQVNLERIALSEPIPIEL